MPVEIIEIILRGVEDLSEARGINNEWKSVADSLLLQKEPQRHHMLFERIRSFPQLDQAIEKALATIKLDKTLANIPVKTSKMTLYLKNSLR